MNGIKVVLLCLMSLLILPVKVQAQTPPTVPPPPKPMTMADALAEAVPPGSGLTLAVGADTTTLPDGEAPPPAGLTVPQITQGFGQDTRRFGTVTAIGPPTMAVLNEHPSGGDPLADMGGQIATKMLMASLSDSQWNALTSESGLGLSDLTSDQQRSFFLALFRHGQFVVCLTPVPGKTQDNDSVRDLSEDIPQTRIRLSQSVRLRIPIQTPSPENGFSIPFSYQTASDDTAKYQIYQGKLPPKTTIDGVQVSAQVPNTLKHGQLDLIAPMFRVSVSLTGLKTVGDLIERISQQTHLEMYADAHYEKKTLTLLGPVQTASASDLLRAVDWSLTAAWRKVGSAYVLTDDITGVGTRREVLSQFHDQMTEAGDPLYNAAEDTIFTKRSARSLPTLGDPLAATADQLAVEKNAADDSGTIFPELPFGKEMPLSALTLAQQAAAHKIAEAYQQSEAAQIAKTPGTAPDLNKEIQVEPSYKLEAVVPGLDSTVNLQPYPLDVAFLFWPGDDIYNARFAPYLAEEEKREAAKNPGPKHTVLTLDALFTTVPRRALLAAPQTPQEVDALIQEMSKIGLNELWLTVFTHGHSRLAESGPDILTEAIKAGRKKKITVYPVIDLMNWDRATAGADADLNLLGQTSEQAETEAFTRLTAKLESQGKSAEVSLLPPPHLNAVSPFALHVQSTLAQTLRSLATRPGIAGLVWKDTDTGNYDKEQYVDNGDPTYLGYTETARLAFLRRYHSDPIDISPGSSYYYLTSTRLPRFDNEAVETMLHSQWRAFRNQQETSFLQTLAAAISQTHPQPLFLKSRSAIDTDGWFGSWDGPHAPIPSYSPSADGSLVSWTDMDKQAKQQSRVSLVLVARPPIPESKSLAAVLDDACYGKAWNGFVLDNTGDKDQAWLKSLAAQCKP